MLVHSVAFAAAEDLEGRFIDTPRDRFWMAVDISAYSFVACAKAAEPLMQARGGGSMVTMTYLGGVRAVPHYNVMGVAKATLDASMRYLAWDLGQSGVRVNAISAGPVRTLAARSIAGFTTMEEMFTERAPAAPPHRRRRRRRSGRLPPLGRRGERDRHDPLRRRRLPRDGHVEPSGRRADLARPRGSPRSDRSPKSVLVLSRWWQSRRAVGLVGDQWQTRILRRPVLGRDLADESPQATDKGGAEAGASYGANRPG